ncbi:MAG: DNA primase, partial [Clostridia bacterium]|nr:DNA primase [Clostridia bacterium]
MIDRQTVEEILSRTDLPTLIGSYVSLKKAGSNMVGLCPFHSEKSPSFTVFPSDNSFYCFGCGVGGNAITFLRKAENLEFADALSVLAKRAGVTLRLYEDRVKSKYSRQRFFEMNKEAARFFHNALLENNPGAKNALAYLTQKRKLSMSTVNHFGLGYAPDGFSFVRFMKEKGFTEEELTVGYLCRKSEKGNLYSLFRNRVMFPIIDMSGNVIAFGGRVMDDETKPKYLNSSDTPVFKKSRNLFALNFSHQNAKEQIILCEGYMDVIALHAAGFPFAVASLGTALTEEQARLLTRYTQKVILSYDADEAGQNAADRALKIFEGVGLETVILRVDGAKDPDEYIRKNGAEKFRELL